MPCEHVAVKHQQFGVHESEFLLEEIPTRLIYGPVTWLCTMEGKGLKISNDVIDV